MTVCVYYYPEAYSTSGKKLMGRNAAGESFLRGYLDFSAESDEFWVQGLTRDDCEDFANQVATYRPKAHVNAITASNLSSLEKASTVYFPGPELRVHAYKRRLYGDDQWSLCGITHTTSSAGAMEAVVEWITAPVQPWDAVICTSSSVKKNVEIILQAQADELKARLGITKIVLPQLPVIPLGIHTKEFVYSDQQRLSARKKIGATAECLVALYTGRLSFHAKAHPLAMYQALEAAAQASNKEVILIECGWHANELIKSAFAEGAMLASPSVRVVNLDGRVAGNREIAWASADVFCSLSDNIQETFGIVPIEAMAAGLPVVVSDWDGYKDTVRDGVDGFRIPTIAPRSGFAGDLAHRHALEIDTYDMYCGHSSSLVAVHAEKLTRAFTELFKSPELRKKMGEAGRLRATQDYDWRTIIPRYEGLWEEQTSIRLAAKKVRKEGNRGRRVNPSVWPARLDPTTGFASYPTTHLDHNTQLMFSESTVEAALQKLASYKDLAMVNYAKFVFPTDEEINIVFEAAASYGSRAVQASQLIKDIELSRRPHVLRGLGWLTKLGFFTFS